MPSQALKREIASEAVNDSARERMYEAFAACAPGMKRIEEKIDSLLGSEAEVLSQITRYLLSTGGKRVRPLMVLLSSRLFGIESPTAQLVDAAAGIELIHMATLLHDDIIDQSPTRRHRNSAFLEFGLSPSLLAGDFLLVKAFGLCATLGEFVVKATENACIDLTEGEVLEGKVTTESPQSEEDYIRVVAKKTASLFALSAKVGAHLSGANPQTVRGLEEFGYASGIAFQIVDDILDITANEDLLGKPVGTDLRQKTPSLVNILWANSGDLAAKKFFALESPDIKLCAETAEYLKTTPIIDACRERARQYAAKAEHALLSISQPSQDETTRKQLLALLDYTLERCL